MAANCPHCQTSIESLPGFIPQADLESRLKSKKDENKALSEALSTARVKASGYDAVVLELGELKSANESREKRTTRLDLLTEAKVDHALLDDIERIYGWSQDGIAEDERKDFGEWWSADAAKHVLLSPHIGAAPTPKPAANDTTGTGVDRLPKPNGSDVPPPSGAKMTQADLAAVFASPQFAALNPEGKRARIAELKAETGQL